MKSQLAATNKSNIYLLSITKLLSGFVNYIYDIGIVIYLYGKTESAAVISGFFISQLLPAFIILLSGTMIDKYNKRNLMVINNFLKIFLFAILIVNQSILSIYIVTFLINLICEFEGNTLNALMPNIFSRNDILKAASIINVLDSIAMITAPLCASFIAVHFNVTTNLAMVIIMSAATTLLYAAVKISNISPKEKITQNSGRKGYNNIFKNKNILTTIIFWSIFMLCIGISTPLEVIMIENKLKMPSSYYGIGNMVEGIGMLISSIFLLSIIRKLESAKIIMMGLFSAALSYFVIGISGNIWIYYIGACLVGITATFGPLGFKTQIQTKEDTAVIGRIFTTSRFVVLLARILGSLLTGIALKMFDLRFIYYSISFLLFLSAIFYFFQFQNNKNKN